MRLVLGSASPRRKEILRLLGYEFTTSSPSVDETPVVREAFGPYLERVVRAKYEAVARDSGDAVVLVADTTVVLHDEILGKPDDDDHARRMLAALAGATHLVATRFMVGHGQRHHAETVITEVDFRPLAGHEIDRYVATGECRDKAGAYAIQGGAAVFVRALRGSLTNVVGLPACEAHAALTSIFARGD